MICLEETLTYEQYIEKASPEQRTAQQEAYGKTELSRNALKKAASLEQEVNAVIFSEGYCPDCVVVIPYLVKLAQKCDKLKLHFMSRSGNEELLQKITGECRIPTIVTFTKEMEPKGVYIEFPDTLKETMAGNSVEAVKAIVNEYREGKYNDLIEKHLLEII
jgi:hypothetical protein